MQRIDDREEKLRSAVRRQLASRERLRRILEDRLRQFDLRPRLRRDRERLTSADFRAQSAIRLQLNLRRQRYETAVARLEQLNPRLVLTRGYAIVLNDRAEILRDAASAPPGSPLKILFAASELKATVVEVNSAADDIMTS
jgi:exodeoxyribonuclease VII large subunit